MEAAGDTQSADGEQAARTLPVGPSQGFRHAAVGLNEG